GVLAAISSGYAFSTVLQSGKLAIALGVFWGAMIFNLDRYLVLSIRNKPPATSSTWKEKVRNWGDVLIVTLPRVALAALLAAAITKPLELLIFQQEIQAEMPSLQADQRKQFQRELDTELGAQGQTTFKSQIDDLVNKNRTLEEEIAKKQVEQEKARQAAVDEAEGRAKLPAGQGKVFELKTKIANAKETEAQDYIKPRQDSIKANNQKIQDLTRDQQEAEQRASEESRKSNGLATQLQAFSRLTSKNPVIRSADLVFMAIILILEIAPILTKIYAKYGPYDKLLDVTEQKVYLEKDLELEDLQNDFQTRRESFERRKEVMTQIQDLVITDTLAATGNPKLESQSYRNLEDAKRVLIEQATIALTRPSENGSGDD